MRTIRYILTIIALAAVTAAFADKKESTARFFNLTFDEVRIDSVMPEVTHVMPLPDNFNDSIYTATILYPEFVDMRNSDIDDYHRLQPQGELTALPVVTQTVLYSRRKPLLLLSVTPLVLRDGKYQFLASFMLKVEAEAKPEAERHNARRAATPAERYAAHSILAEGSWAKISVAESGYHALTESVIRKAGFKNLANVRIYGYGGNLQPESLSPEYIIAHDDLQEVPSVMEGGRRVFYAEGPVSWSSVSSTTRTRNPYSDYGYYFITEGDAPASVMTADEFRSVTYPAKSDYHTIYEVDNYAPYHGGRNLFDGTTINVGASRSISINSPSDNTSGKLTVVAMALLGASSKTNFSVAINDSVVGNITVEMEQYDKAASQMATFNVKNLKAVNTVTVKCTSGTKGFIDYVALTSTTPKPAPDYATASLPEAQFVYRITNQDHHADPQADMVIIIPTSQKLKDQAERLADMHRAEGLKVNVVPADELYNEFSSGTPDATAYKRYLKMLYDRATDTAMAPRFLLLFGDGVYDNRLNQASMKHLKADDLLLCYESENSFNEVSCYVADDFFTLLDDNEKLEANSSYSLFLSQRDAAVGRIPAITDADAKVVVDKCLAYQANTNADKWKNTIAFLSDDGNNNLHMEASDELAEKIAKNYPGYNIKKYMWDAYNMEVTSTGNRYPDLSKEVKALHAEGALIFNYAGHGGPALISPEAVLTMNDFHNFQNRNLPIWITASCDIMPFDGIEANNGEAALLNPRGGAVAFIGTTRTVYADKNKTINTAIMHYLLADDSKGMPMTIGEAFMLAKNYVSTNGDNSVNKINYTLAGDPALRIKRPQADCVVESYEIDGKQYEASQTPRISAGSKVKITGRVKRGVTKPNVYTDFAKISYDNVPGVGDDIPAFNGTVSVLMRDSRELVTCYNNAGETDKKKVPIEKFTFYDYKKTIFNGTDSIRDGRFNVSFVVPQDINYSNESGLLTMYAVNKDRSIQANGEDQGFTIGGTVEASNDGIGPSIFCYLNNPSFTNGGTVNITPYFYAEINDKDGINVSGTGVGHDLQLSIDNSMGMTFKLNDNFQFDFGSYTSGSTFYSIPELSEGTHKLTFRAWDILNNPSTTELYFVVKKNVLPNIADISVTKNPATTSTTFIIQHDQIGTELTFSIDIMDMSGRLLHTIVEKGTPATGTYTIDWDLTTATGNRLQTGVYLYRVRLDAAASKGSSLAKKLIIISQ